MGASWLRNYDLGSGAVKSLALVSLVLSLVHIDRCTHSNSEPEKCCPTKRTIGSLRSFLTIRSISVSSLSFFVFIFLKIVSKLKGLRETERP